MTTKEKVQRLKIIRQLYGKQRKRRDNAVVRMADLDQEHKRIVKSLSADDRGLYAEKISRYAPMHI